MPARRRSTEPRTPRLRILPATPTRWSDVERLFGERGACAGCWCMWWRLQAADWRRGKGAGNRRAFRRVVASGVRPGLIAYAGREPVGWCAVAPRADYPRFERSRVLAPVDDTPVWSISCLFVDRDHRGRGVASALVKAAAAFAAKQGARVVEGYPVDARGRQPDAFVWTGLPSSYRKAGFREVARRSKSRPIMRKTLRG